MLTGDFTNSEANNVLTTSGIFDLRYDPDCETLFFMSGEFKFPLITMDGKYYFNLKDMRLQATDLEKANGQAVIPTAGTINHMMTQLQAVSIGTLTIKQGEHV